MTLAEISIRDWKYQLIEQLFKVEDVATLKEVETALKNKATLEAEKRADLEARIFKPMRKTVTAEQLEREQNYQPMNAEDFFKEVREINLNENIDELLEMLD
jgi:hypothetical protein